MNKQTLKRYCSAVDDVGEFMDDPENNRFAKKAKEFINMRIDFDEFGIYVKKSEIIVAVNGSDGADEWKSNFNMYPLENGSHNGFYNKGLIAHGEIEPILLVLMEKYGVKKVVYVGHSRGGAIAQVMCEHSNVENKQVVTFGSPRVYSRKHAKTLKFKHTRVYYKKDPVRNVPCSWIPPGWRHYQSDEIELTKRIKGEFSHLHYLEYIDLNL